MAREFSEHRQDFDTLLAMVREDGRVTRIDPNWVDEDSSHHLSTERLARYRSLFKALNLQAGIVRRDDGSIGFLRSGGGIVSSGWSKEFFWSQGFKGPAITASDPRRVEDLCKPKSGCSSARQLAPG